MGLFDFLFGKSRKSHVESLPDRIWMNVPAKYAGLAEDLKARAAGGSNAILLVAHFESELEKLVELAAAHAGKIQITPILARDLPEVRASDQPVDRSRTIDLIVAERHPLWSADAAVLERAKNLPCICRVVHYVSLQDPVMRIFAGPWVNAMLKNLGMKENESIESRMVTRRIQAAQKKCPATSNLPAKSAEEWCRLNVPGWQERAV